MKIKKESLYKTYDYGISTFYKIIKHTNESRRNPTFELWKSRKLKGSLVIVIHKNLITDTCW